MLNDRLTAYHIDAVVLVVLAAGGFVANKRETPLKQQQSEDLAQVRSTPISPMLP